MTCVDLPQSQVTFFQKNGKGISLALWRGLVDHQWLKLNLIKVFGTWLSMSFFHFQHSNYLCFFKNNIDIISSGNKFEFECDVKYWDFWSFVILFPFKK